MASLSVIGQPAKCSLIACRTRWKSLKRPDFPRSVGLRIEGASWLGAHMNRRYTAWRVQSVDWPPVRGRLAVHPRVARAPAEKSQPAGLQSWRRLRIRPPDGRRSAQGTYEGRATAVRRVVSCGRARLGGSPRACCLSFTRASANASRGSMYCKQALPAITSRDCLLGHSGHLYTAPGTIDSSFRAAHEATHSQTSRK